MIPLAFLALLLPGLAWWAWLGRRGQDPLVSLAEILGVSLASLILLAQGFFILKVRITPLVLTILLPGLAALTIIGMIKRRVKGSSQSIIHTLIGFALFAMIIAFRLYQARGLILPNWVDPQHHALIVRVILEQGGLPHDLSPYLSIPFYYHFGFHAIAALFTPLSGLGIGAAMLILGQVLNATISLSVYALGKALWQDWRPAAAAALLVGFATRMPAYYLTWGRYTLTIGLIFLPLAMAVAIRLLRKYPRPGDILTLALLTAGTLLSHYFAGFLLASFLLILALSHHMRSLPQRRTALKRLILPASGAVIGLLLSAPWLWRVAQFSPASLGVKSNLPQTFNDILGSRGAAYIWQLLGPASNYWLLLAGGIGLLLAFFRRSAPAFIGWSLLMGVLSLPASLVFQPFRADHFAIVLILPVCLWSGWLFWQIGRQVSKWVGVKWLLTLLSALITAGWIAWSLPSTVKIVNPLTVLVTEADVAALDWIEDNTPPDARFLINTAYWQFDIYRSVDGGGWILPRTGRWTILPTVFYSFSPDAEDKAQWMDWGAKASQLTGCTSSFWDLVTEASLNYIYLREDAGSLKPAQLADCEGLRPVYQQDGVWIYTIDP